MRELQKQTKKKCMGEAGTAWREREGPGCLGSGGAVYWTRAKMTDCAGSGAKLALEPALSTLDHAPAHEASHELVEACIQRGSCNVGATAFGRQLQ